MQSQAPAGPSRETGLPPGVEVGPLGARVVAYLIDSVVPAILGIILGFLAPGLSGGSRVVLSTVLVLLMIAWAVFVLIMIAGRAASPGMRVMKLQLVGFYDGRPIGLPRALLRGLVFWALSVTGVGLVIMLVLLVIHPRRQGWHDRLAEAVVIKARMLAPLSGAAISSPVSSPSVVPLDPREQYGPPSAGPQAQQSPPQEAYPAAQQSPAQQPPGLPTRGQQYVEQHSPPLYAPNQRDPFPAPVPAPSPALVPVPAPALVAVPAPAPDAAATPDRDAEVDADADGGTDGHFDGDETRLHVPVSSSGWAAVLDDGRRLLVDGLVLLGRNPQPQPGEEDAQLVKLADETRTVSKSHLAIGLDETGIYVIDRGSTNGSTVTNAGGASTRCRVGEPVSVGEDTIVSMGDHWLRIERADG